MREPFLPQLDAWEFHHWEDRQPDKHELHHGFIVAFAGGTIDHDTLAINLCVALRKAFPSPCRTFSSDVKVQVSDSTVYYANAGVVCAEVRGDATVVTAPTVVCEVLSESTRAYDLVEKRAAYRSVATLTAYVIVHTRTRRIEIDKRYSGDKWQTVAIDDGKLPLGDGTISLQEIYELTSIPHADPSTS